MRLAPFLDDRLLDVRWTWRSLRRTPGTALLGVVSLALGIGANSAAISYE